MKKFIFLQKQSNMTEKLRESEKTALNLWKVYESFEKPSNLRPAVLYCVLLTGFGESVPISGGRLSLFGRSVSCHESCQSYADRVGGL